MRLLLVACGPSFEIGSVAAWRHAASDRDRCALMYRVDQSLRAIEDAEQESDHLGPPTGALLPTSFAKRVELLLGKGALPLAWIRSLDVLAF